MTKNSDEALTQSRRGTPPTGCREGQDEAEPRTDRLPSTAPLKDDPIYQATFLRIKEILDKNHIDYNHIQHEFVHRSEEAAKIRGSKYEEAAKALILKGDNDIVMAVVPGPQRMDYRLLRKEIGFKKLSLASPDDVKAKTGLTIGSVPPFGNLWNIPVYVEESLLHNEYMVFSAGSHHDSIRLKVQDYLKVVPAKVLTFRRID